MTPVSSVKATESYEVCRRLIRGLPVGLHTSSSPKRVGLIPHQTRLCGLCIAAIAGNFLFCFFVCYRAMCKTDTANIINCVDLYLVASVVAVWPRSHKTFFKLNLAEHEI